MIEKILKPIKTTFKPATVTAVNTHRKTLQVKLTSTLEVSVDAAGLSPDVGDVVIVAQAGRDGGRFAVQKTASFLPGTQMTVVV